MTDKLKSHLDVVKEELRQTEQKRLAQFPVRVRKVKRLRRQITELNRALRREKRTVTEMYEMVDRALSVNAENVQTLKGWKEMYESANSRAESWKRLTYSMGWIGFVVGGVAGSLGGMLFSVWM